MTRGTQSGAKQVDSASKAKGRFLGGTRKKIFALFAKSLFWRGTGEAESRRAAGRR